MTPRRRRSRAYRIMSLLLRSLFMAILSLARPQMTQERSKVMHALPVKQLTGKQFY